MNENQEEEELNFVNEEEIQHLKQHLPKATVLNHQRELVKYQGFWYISSSEHFMNTLKFQRHFRARNSDIIVASFPKCGTTWLKALLFAVVNRFKYPKDENPLLKHHPHELVCCLESDIYGNAFEYPRPCNLKELPSPRLLHTHVPYSSQPESIRTSGCRILYITRNPLDTFVSMYYFMTSSMRKFKKDFNPPSIEDFFEDFYAGQILYGPFFEQVLEYWKESLERPDKVLFLQYEDLKDDPKLHVKRLAEFVGMPFSMDEEAKGIIDDIIKMCSIGNLQELEVNKSGVINKYFEKKSYFRKGRVGDWTNHFTPSMAERMNKLMQEKLEGTGLSFKIISSDKVSSN